ncbi:MAG: hypothetical protein AB7V42_13105 [Thermoleophilia bacterium]
MSTQAPSLTLDPDRRQSGLGGLVPSAAVARAGDTLLLVQCVELHAEGAVLPVLVLSEAPGLLGWDPAAGGLTVTDDGGREYAVEMLDQQSGLGALQTAVWIAPAPPPEARELRLRATALVRTAASRGGRAVERPLTGESWELTIPLYPDRTTAQPPDEPLEAAPEAPPARVPARTLGGFRALVPVGQARMTDGAAICLWAIERYEDRGVLTVAALAEEPLRVAPLAPGSGRVEIWDDRGGRYSAAPIHGAVRPGWSETSLELSPAIDPRARALAVRLSDLPGEGPQPRGREALAGPFTFGVALPGEA